MSPHANGGGRAIIRPCFALENGEKEQLLLIEWGKFTSMGGAFAFPEGDVKKLVIFQRIGGPCRDRTYDQLIKRRPS
jgi:hypothetical protein